MPADPIEPAIADAIRRALSAGASVRQAARAAGVSVTCAQDFASERKPTVPERIVLGRGERRTFRRCGGCGGKIVVEPCRLCRTRSYADGREDPRREAGGRRLKAGDQRSEVNA